MQASVKEDRQRWIGGSDIPVIMDISPFQSRYNLLLYKAGIRDGEFEGNKYTEYGNIMESKIRDFINETYNDNYIETQHIDEELGYRCHLDGENKDSVLEIKTTSQIHDNINDYKIYLVQLLFYMMNTNKNKGVLAVYKRPDNFDEEFDVQKLNIYYIDIYDYKELCEEIIHAVKEFKNDLEKIKGNPLLTEEDFIPVSVKELSEEIIKIEEQLVAYKELEKQEKELKNKLYESMVKYNIKNWKTPNGLLISKVNETSDTIVMEFNENKFKEEKPEEYKKYCEEKIKKGKSGYVRISK